MKAENLEQILKDYDDFISANIDPIGGGIDELRKQFLKQRTIEPSELVTDEEIEEEARHGYHYASIDRYNRQSFAVGAKWMRGEAKAIDLEQELNNYGHYLRKKFYSEMFEIKIESESKEYLKQR